MTVRPTTIEDAPLFDECRERFLREAQALVLLGRASGTSDGIVRVQTYFEAFGTCFLVMDYIQGESLANLLRRHPDGLPPDRVSSLVRQLLDSMRIVHQAGLLHRDIKPANIILRGGDRLVLIDFGATRQSTPTDATTYTQIYSGGYGPPEQMLGLPQGPFSDIYAIGGVCYRAIGGSVVDALARQNSLAAGRDDPLRPVTEVGAGRYPPRLLAAISAALTVDATQRPQSIEAMQALLGFDQPAAGAEIPSATPTERNSRKAVWMGTAASAVVVLAGIAYVATRPSAPPAPVVAAQPPAEVQTPPQIATPPPPVAASTPEPAPPAIAPPVPAQEPQQEAVIVPPVAPMPPAPPPVSALERARSAVGSLPCSALRFADDSGTIRLSGFASAGPELNRLLSDLRSDNRVVDDATYVDRAACPAIAALAPALRRAADAAPPQLSIRLEQPTVTAGSRTVINVAGGLPAVYLDVYQPDGMVRHLLQPSQSGSPGRTSADWYPAPPPGTRVIVAMGAMAPLDLGTRPAVEREAVWLDVLRSRLADTSSRVIADLAMVIVRPAEPPAVKPPPVRPAGPSSAKCANIVSRAQLGETLSDAELTALRTECRS